MCGQLCRGLVAAQVPVVTEFSVFKAPGEEKVGMVIYTGRAPAYKLILTQEMLHEGWGFCQFYIWASKVLLLFRRSGRVAGKCVSQGDAQDRH